MPFPKGIFSPLHCLSGWPHWSPGRQTSPTLGTPASRTHPAPVLSRNEQPSPAAFHRHRQDHSPHASHYPPTAPAEQQPLPSTSTFRSTSRIYVDTRLDPTPSPASVIRCSLMNNGAGYYLCFLGQRCCLGTGSCSTGTQ